MDQILNAFLVALLVIICNILWLMCRYFWLLSPGFLPEQNSEIADTVTPSDDTTPKMLYGGVRPKQKAIHSSTEIKRRCYKGKMTISCTHRNLASPRITTKWAENKEVICRLKGEVKPSISIKSKVPSKVNKLTRALLNTSDALIFQKQIHELS